ncbi:MAG: caspase family protein [Pseudomonadota bacterium]
MNLTRLLMSVILVALVVVAMPGSAAMRGVTVSLRAEEKIDAPIVETVELYTESHALVIGIDNYTNGWPKLSNAVKDAELIAEELAKKGFSVDLQKNLNSTELKDVLRRFFSFKGQNPNARLFIWFAGHGMTLDDEGYLVPADAPLPNGPAATGEFKYTSFQLRDFGGLMRLANSKHAYAVFDSCFAGTVFASQRAVPPPAITRATTMPVRQFLTSGDAEQKVSDDGTFRELFIRALNGEERADANMDGYLTASELGMFLNDRVTNLTEELQTPRYGKLRDKNFDRGDFVFELPGTVAQMPESGPAQPQQSAEIAFWNSIKDSDNVGEFDAYLSQYPQGNFSQLAMARKADLQKRLEQARQRARAKETFKVRFIDQDMQANATANVRETPFPSASRVGQLEPGAFVWAVGETQTDGGTWYKVARDGVELGFVWGQLLTSVGSEVEVVAVEPLPMPDVIAARQAAEQARVAAEESAAGQAAADALPKTASQQLSFLVEDLLQEVAPVDVASPKAVPASTATPDSAITTEDDTVVTQPPIAMQGQSTQALAEQLVAAVNAQDDEASMRLAGQLIQSQPSLQRAATASTDSDRALEASLVDAITRQDVAVAPSETLIPAPASGSGTVTVGEAGSQAAAEEAARERAARERAAHERAAREKAEEEKAAAEIAAAEAAARVKATEQLALLTNSEQSAEPQISAYLRRYLMAAEDGNAKAQLSLGYMYETGEQVAVDKLEAAKWYRRAADAGEVPAMIRLALMYESGDGVAQDSTEAAVWYRKAANEGDADAQQTLAYMYENGIGVVKDVAEAARWYEKAAQQGRIAAQNNLGRFYQLGIGVAQDLDKAIFWYEKAASQGSEAAQNNLNQLIPGG